LFDVAGVDRTRVAIVAFAVRLAIHGGEVTSDRCAGLVDSARIVVGRIAHLFAIERGDYVGKALDARTTGLWQIITLIQFTSVRHDRPEFSGGVTVSVVVGSVRRIALHQGRPIVVSTQLKNKRIGEIISAAMINATFVPRTVWAIS
jgi:hypothetical protein